MTGYQTPHEEEAKYSHVPRRFAGRVGMLAPGWNAGTLAHMPTCTSLLSTSTSRCEGYRDHRWTPDIFLLVNHSPCRQSPMRGSSCYKKEPFSTWGSVVASMLRLHKTCEKRQEQTADAETVSPGVRGQHPHCTGAANGIARHPQP